MRIFAVPFGNGGADEGGESERGVVWKIIDKADRNKNKESTTKYRERLTRALIPSRNEQQSGSGERYNYTMKSLILAQDER